MPANPAGETANVQTTATLAFPGARYLIIRTRIAGGLLLAPDQQVLTHKADRDSFDRAKDGRFYPNGEPVRLVGVNRRRLSGTGIGGNDHGDDG
jgi:hypothetical protein